MHVEDTVLPNKVPSIDGVLCGNNNVGVDGVDDMSPTFGNVGAGRIGLVTITPRPNDSKLVLTDHFFHLNVILEEISRLRVSCIG